MADVEHGPSEGFGRYRIDENELHDFSSEAADERRKRLEGPDDPQNFILLSLQLDDSGLGLLEVLFQVDQPSAVWCNESLDFEKFNVGGYMVGTIELGEMGVHGRAGVSVIDGSRRSWLLY